MFQRFAFTSVPDHGSRDRDVVLVRCTIGSGKPQGSGIWNGEGEVSLRATWDQGGRDCFTSKEGFQVSKKGWKGKVTGYQQGEKKGELRYNLHRQLYMCI
jgi:hypothetical protein